MKLDNYIEYIKEKHKGQTRKQGTPYYLHPLEVSNILDKKGFSKEYQIVGLFHDLLEDTEATEQEILDLTNEAVLEAVKLVTKEEGYQMKEYIDRISKNPIAKAVKLADRLHNLQEATMASKEFQNKYQKETEEWYLNLAKDTMFEQEIQEAYQKIAK